MTTSTDQEQIGVIGGGAAGMSCALWLKRLGFIPVIIEKDTSLGGQMRHIHRINRWILGEVEKTSAELAESYSIQIKQEGISVFCNSRLESVSENAEGFQLTLNENGNLHSLQVRGLVIATGVSVLGVEQFKAVYGFQEVYAARLISFFPLDHLDKLKQLKDKVIAIVGGGNNAYFTALDAAKAGIKVFLLIRSNPKARSNVRKEADFFVDQGLITVLTETQISGFRSEKGKFELDLKKSESSSGFIGVDHVFVRTGFAPNTEFFDNFEGLSKMVKESGYIKTDVLKRTSIPWVYAIGDVANARHQSVVCAISDGAIAAQDLSERM